MKSRAALDGHYAFFADRCPVALTFVFEKGKLVRSEFVGPGSPDFKALPGIGWIPDPYRRELRAYFSGEPVSFRGWRVDGSGHSPFGRRVLRLLRRVGWGKTIGYGELAALAGSPRGARAVGRVMRANRTPLIVPCHRVVRSGGALGGYGAGVKIKKTLLALEGAGALS
jgi:methylated-DNA-[protein]-cysteine S-methyltransferase